MTSDNPVTDTLVTGLLATRRAREAPVRHRIHHLFPAAKKRTAAAVIQIFTYLPRPKNSRFEKNHRLIEQHLAPALGLRLRPALMFRHLLSCLYVLHQFYSSSVSRMWEGWIFGFSSTFDFQWFLGDLPFGQWEWEDGIQYYGVTQYLCFNNGRLVGGIQLVAQSCHIILSRTLLSPNTLLPHNTVLSTNTFQWIPHNTCSSQETRRILIEPCLRFSI